MLLTRLPERVTHALLAMSLVFVQSTVWADALKPEPRELLQAIESADTERVQMLLPAADPNAANAKGETALMLAAQKGNFELCRALLWAGADANRKDSAGKRARDHLKRNAAGFTAVNLLLRCYAFVQQHKTDTPHPQRPEMVLVSDAYIDHQHAGLKDRYWANSAELKGESGKDDDGNGFIDDVYGWNAEDDEPLRAPLFANLAETGNRDLLRKFVTLYNRSKSPDDEAVTEWKDLSFDDLHEQYENPLVKQLGYETLMSGDFDVDDFAFTRMLVSASHGTHVAGIVMRASNGQALLHGMTHGQFHTPKQTGRDLVALARQLAPRTVSYDQFLVQLRQTLLNEALEHGKRRSAYLRSTGAGVVNMSWSQSKGVFVRAAEQVKDIYEDNGMDPKSIDHYVCPIGLDLCSDLGLEMLVAAAAEFALMIHENLDVLFVMAAGNESENNDEELPSPAYLSRFFPNVITVASVDEDDELSEFSNFGAASVQVAAPGENIRSSFIADQEGLMSGTSMAAPAVAGLAARVRAEHSKLSAADVRIILERSVDPIESLSGRVASGGVVFPEEAIKLASLWQPGSRSDLTLTALAKPKAPADKADEGESNGESADHVDNAISVGADEKGLRISSLGGFADQWRVIMSDGTGFAEQSAHPKGPLPIDWIKSKWSQGWEISSIGGEANAWRVVMSKGSGHPQKLVGLEFDQTSIDQLSSSGYKITSMAGYMSSWVFVMTSGTDWGEQRYTLPGAFDDKRKAWIAARMKEGYRITSLAGDDSEKDRSKDCWVTVMTKGTAIGEQVINGPSPWPEAWISEQAAAGFSITQCSGFGDHWVVVMSKGTSLGKQTISDGAAWSDEWVAERWSGKP